MEITGLILSGGQSKRMGSDKGTLLKDNQPWVRLIANLFTDLKLSYKVSINSEQVNNYQKLFIANDLIIDAVEIPGPLRGILSTHIIYPDKNWLVMACDMIDMDKTAMSYMLNSTKENPGYDFYAYKNESFFEPFCGIYTSKGMAKVYQDYQQGKISNYSLQSVFNNFSTFPGSLKNDASAFKNYNTFKKGE